VWRCMAVPASRELVCAEVELHVVQLVTRRQPVLGVISMRPPHMARLMAFLMNACDMPAAVAREAAPGPGRLGAIVTSAALKRCMASARSYGATMLRSFIASGVEQRLGGVCGRHGRDH
jgi:hypothetical protein